MTKQHSMQSIRKDLEKFHGQLRTGVIQTAYRTLLSYMMGLRTHFKNRDPESPVSSLYQGYMDMTYFAIFPPSLKRRDLKIAIVFNYDDFRFEAWLAGKNRKINRQYFELLKGRKWPGYRVVTPAVGMDSILECDLVHGFDLSDADAVTTCIERGTSDFLKAIEAALLKV